MTVRRSPAGSRSMLAGHLRDLKREKNEREGGGDRREAEKSSRRGKDEGTQGKKLELPYSCSKSD